MASKLIVNEIEHTDGAGTAVTGTISAAGITGVLPVGVTGGSGLTALGTVTAGNLSHADIVYPAGHVVQMKQDFLTGKLSVSATTTGVAIDSTNFKVGITPTKTGNNIIINLHYTIGRGVTYAAGAFCQRTGPSTVAELGTVGTGGTHNAGGWDYYAGGASAYASSINHVMAWATDTAQDTSTEHVYIPMMKTNGSATLYMNARENDGLWAGVSTITIWEVVV